MNARLRLVAVSMLLSACGGASHARVYRLSDACGEVEDTAEVRRCVGRLLDESMAASLGLYPDHALQAYVRRVALRVVPDSSRPANGWTFRILDDPSVGAWASPDAHIYVTRGLLAALDNEAELAAVLAHEVAHVLSGHADMALDRLPQLDSGDWSDEFRLSRDDEAQADQLSVRYLRAAGYAPRAIRSALRTIYRFGEDEGSYSARHPPLPVRLALTARAADGVTQGRRARARYLRHVEGLVVGPDPRRGRLDGSRYVHERGAFSFVLPPGFHEWEPGAGHGRGFAAERSEGHVGLSLMHLARGRESIENVAVRESLEGPSARRFELAGYAAFEARWESAQPSPGTWREERVGRVVVFEAHDHQSYALVVTAPVADRAAVDAVFSELLHSVRRERGRSRPMRLSVRRFPHVMTLASVVGAGCAQVDRVALFMNLNGLVPDQIVEADRRVKCIRVR